MIISRVNNLTGVRFEKLTALEKVEGSKNGYCLWRCRCDCGNEIIVTSKDLTAKRKVDCGCEAKKTSKSWAKEDRTGKKYGALTALKPAGKPGDRPILWECECECGKHVLVRGRQLQRREVKDCGCGLGDKPKYADIAGQKKGMLTALYATDKRDRKGNVIWRCRCDCGNEMEMSEGDFKFGSYVSCGCVRQQRWDDFQPEQLLTFVDGTCLEWIAKRKSRNDNSSGYRGVCKSANDKYRVFIGLKGEKYYLGQYETFEEAVAVRKEVEEFLHDGFLSNYEEWKKKAEADINWASRHPFYFNVTKEDRTFRIESAISEPQVLQY